MVKNIFVAGLDVFHLSQLKSLKSAHDYKFHSLISYNKIKCSKRFPVREFVEDSCRNLKNFQGNVDAVVGFWDFPVSTLLPYIRGELNLIGPSLQAVLKCEHKYWSRVLQSEVVPQMVPPFRKINPFDDDAATKCDLPFPFWLKPVKSVLSYLGFLVNDSNQFTLCLDIIRRKIGRYGDPFNYILDLADLPPEIRKVDGYHCIAEGLISKGRQCTLEGYVYNGTVCVYGAVDSVRSGQVQSSFSRYQYPSTLPKTVQERMIEATERVLTYIKYDNSPFNIEFYWDDESNSISLLEINTRISKSHCPLFKMVDGEYHHSVMIDVALGNNPEFSQGKGAFKTAAKFMIRRFEDGLVERVPQKNEIDDVKRNFPGTEVIIGVSSGMLLSELRDQDSYSYQIGDLFMGAGSNRELLKKYQVALSMLPFRIESKRAVV